MRAFITIVALCLLAADCTDPGTERNANPSGIKLGPPIPSPGSSLLAIDGASTDDIWAVGEVHGKTFHEASLIEHWDGTSWSIVAAPDVRRLRAIVAITVDDAWALGGAAVLHWDGTSWREVLVPRGIGASYVALSASGPDDLWLAGTRRGPIIGANTRGLSTVVAHFDGRRWTVMHPPNPGTRDNYLQGIVALAPHDVWAAGYSSDVGKNEPEASSLTMHWDGSKWSVVPSPDPSHSLNVIWGMGSDGGSGIWGLGHYRAADHHLHALVLRWNGSMWARIIVHGSSTWSPTMASGTSADDVWVLGSEPTSTLALAHCEGNACRTTITPASGPNAIGEGVVAFTRDDAWLVGWGTGSGGQATPFLERWNGTTWTEVAAPSGTSSS